MKILFYSHTGQVSGAEKVLLLALKRLDRNRIHPVAVCPDGDLASEITALGIEVSIIPPLEARFTWRVDKFIKYLSSLFASVTHLRSTILGSGADAVHSNSIRAGIVALFATTGTQLPVFWHIQDELKRHPASTVIRLLVACSSRLKLIAVSEATATSFRGRVLSIGKPRPIRVIHNGIELERYLFDPANRSRIREELQIPADEFVIGIVGQITPRKGQLELIRTFARTRRQMPNATLLIIGSPMFNKDHAFLETLKKTVNRLNLSDRVKFLGHRKDIPVIMQALDVLVVNSKSEAFVIVAIEAMACGTPVIATNVGGTGELIQHETNGWLVPTKEDALQTALLTFHDQPELRARLGEAGKQIVFAKLTAEKFIWNLEDFLVQSVSEANGGAEYLVTGPNALVN